MMKNYEDDNRAYLSLLFGSGLVEIWIKMVRKKELLGRG